MTYWNWWLRKIKCLLGIHDWFYDETADYDIPGGGGECRWCGEPR